MEEEQSSESSGILKKFRGRFAMARLKAIESRFGFRYEGQSHILTYFASCRLR
jgi:hypothetical protein